VITYENKKTFQYDAPKLYDIVKDVESYPRFIPNIGSATIIQHENNEIIADLVIEFEQIKKKYTSHITLTPHERIEVKSIRGPFKFLHCTWVFNQIKECETEVCFKIKFEMNFILNGLFGRLFQKSCTQTMEAFEKRVNDIYNTPSNHPYYPK
jgi:coenzyme Q-binding protein COQ10